MLRRRRMAVGLADHVVPQDGCGAAVGQEERGEDGESVVFPAPLGPRSP